MFYNPFPHQVTAVNRALYQRGGDCFAPFHANNQFEPVVNGPFEQLGLINSL